MTYAKISKIAKCSTGAVAKELAEWKKEIEEGRETVISDDIPEAILDQGHCLADSQTSNIEVEPAPLEIVRF